MGARLAQLLSSLPVCWSVALMQALPDYAGDELHPAGCRAAGPRGA
jgi:hypothetical protein